MNFVKRGQELPFLILWGHLGTLKIYFETLQTTLPGVLVVPLLSIITDVSVSLFVSLSLSLFLCPGLVSGLV